MAPHPLGLLVGWNHGPHALRTVTTRWDAASVFAYLLDFEHAEEWDAGTVSCERLTGEGGVGTTYRNVSKFLGRETTLDYEVEKLVPGQATSSSPASNKTVVSKDTVTVTPSAQRRCRRSSTAPT